MTTSVDLRIRPNKAPFPWFGGKSKAAPLVWSLLGDPAHYVEAFAGALGVLLERPHPCNRTYFSETINDLDGFVVNAWRSIQWHPEETAEYASWPVSEADKIARQLAALRWKRDNDLEHLMGDPHWCDPLVAGYWLYGVCCQIGTIGGPWIADPATGRIMRQDGARGTSRNRPHLSDDGRGVNRPQAREPGVFRDRPPLGGDGRGVDHAGAREPGVSHDLPHLTSDGQGVNRPQAREPGVRRNLPHLTSDGQGVNRPQAREPGVRRNLPHLTGNGMGVNHAGAREPGVSDMDASLGDWAPEQEFHPVTMPQLVKWFQWLAARLRHVRIVNGDWSRVCTSGAAKTLPVRQKQGVAGIFLDPPYDNAVRAGELYSDGCDSGHVTEAVRKWCIENGDDPQYRIVLAGYDVEHAELEEHGWTVHEWFTQGYLSGGYGNVAKGTGNGDNQQHRERLWASPHCLDPSGPAKPVQMGLFTEEDD